MEKKKLKEKLRSRVRLLQEREKALYLIFGVLLLNSMPISAVETTEIATSNYSEEGTCFEEFSRNLQMKNPPIVEQEEKQVVNTKNASDHFCEIKSMGGSEIDTPFSFGHSLSDNINLYFAIQGGVGYSNFMWDAGPVNGTISYSADIVAQLYFENRVSFIPANWYSELSIGYDKKGAAKFDMNYVHAKIYPFGYRILLSPVSIVVKGGAIFGLPLGKLETGKISWGSDFQYGVGGGFQVEWKQFSIGCNMEYDFTNVSSSWRHTLNNIAVLGTITYKFAKLGHK